MNDIGDDLLQRDEVARLLGIERTPKAVYALPIPRVALSPRRTRWRREDVEAYLSQNPGMRPRRTLLPAADILKQPVSAPTEPGVYFLILRSEIVYVGQSTNPLARIGQHATEREFDSFVVLPCERNDLLTIEGAYILALRPRYNKVGL